METPVFARDLDLIRDVLLWAEKGGGAHDAPPADPIKLAYHAWLARDAGFLSDKTIIAEGPLPGEHVGRYPIEVLRVGLLTAKGQDALKAIGDSGIWGQTKAAMEKHALPRLLDLSLAIAKGYAAMHGIPIAG